MTSRLNPILSTCAALILLCYACRPASSGDISDGLAHLPQASKSDKIEGVSFVGNPHPINHDSFNPVIDIEAEWVSLMPYAYSESSKGELSWDGQTWQWWGEGFKGNEETVKIAHQRGLKVMMKPHLWLKHGEYTGHFTLGQDENKWHNWEKEYTAYIMQYARLAEQEGIEMLCIATEMDKWAEERPQYWISLIDTIRKVYNGPLTYAGNWDGYKRISFWEKLDYVGIDAYFPLATNAADGLEEWKNSWAKWNNELATFSKEKGKQILFCEYGFRSMPDAAISPWETQRGGDVDLNVQAELYKCLYQHVWDEDWLAGGFVWKWFADHEKVGGSDNNRFTPQNKPAQDVIKAEYSKK